MSAEQRRRHLARLTALQSERTSGGWESDWREVAEHILPERLRLTAAEEGQRRRPAKMINGAPKLAHRVLVAGMMAGISSPSRPWFRLTLPNPMLAKSSAVKEWLAEVEETLRTYFAKSNVYNCLHQIYSDLAGFGITACFLEEDFEDGIRGYVYPVGRYWLAVSARGKVDTIYREATFTVAQLVERFGLEACSTTVRLAWERGQFETKVEVGHVVEPNKLYVKGKAGSRNMRFKSCWFEKVCDHDQGYLRESGYEDFPVLTPRWGSVGMDAWGNSPAMDAIADCRALQKNEERKHKATALIVQPPMVGPPELAALPTSLSPGAINAVSTAAGRFEPAVVIPPGAVNEARITSQEIADQIARFLYADLWLALSQSDGTMTAREVSERHEEKMLQLGPVLEQLEDELLDPLIGRSFAILNRAGYIPPPPEELQGQELRVEYISILAQAQRLLGVTSIERFTGYVTQLSQFRPDALDMLGVDEAINAMAESLGAPPGVALDAERVSQIREARAQAQQEQAQAEQQAQQATQIKELSQAKLGEDNALDRMLQQMGAPSAGAMAGLPPESEE